MAYLVVSQTCDYENIFQSQDAANHDREAHNELPGHIAELREQKDSQSEPD